MVDSQNESGFLGSDPYLDSLEKYSIFCVPLLQNDEVIGVISAENKDSSLRITSEREKILEVLATQAAVAIRNSLIYHEMEQRILERTQAYADLNKQLESRVHEQVTQIKRLGQLSRFLSPKVAEIVLNEPD